MNVLLIRPNGVSDEIIPPISLGYLASAIREEHRVTILDCLKENFSPNRMASYLRGNSFDAVGVTAFTKDMPAVRDCLSLIKEMFPSTLTLLGGAHITALPEATLRYLGRSLDFGFVGEAEGGLPLLLRALEDGHPEPEALERIGGLVWRQGDEVRVNPFCFSEDLDRLRCSWDLISPESYPQAPHGAYFKKFPIAPLIVTRGCPYLCTFCAAPLLSGKKVRRRSLDSVMAEIEDLYHRHGIREVHIEDDNLTLDTRYVKEFCRRLEASGLALAWTCPNGVRLDSLDEETVVLMKQAGCYALSVGIESGSPRILRLVKKQLTKELIRSRVEMIARAGIEVCGFFILGFPGETREEIEDTIRFALELPLIRATFSNYQPFPGTEDFCRLVECGDVEEDIWQRQRLSLHDTSYAPEGVGIGYLRRARKRALLRFYLRPRVIWQMAAGIRSPSHLKTVLARSFRWLTVR